MCVVVLLRTVAAVAAAVVRELPEADVLAAVVCCSAEVLFVAAVTAVRTAVCVLCEEAVFADVFTAVVRVSFAVV